MRDGFGRIWLLAESRFDDGICNEYASNKGEPCGWCCAYFLPNIIGPAKTHEIMPSDRDISAAEAMALGVVHEVVPVGDLEEKSSAPPGDGYFYMM